MKYPENSVEIIGSGWSIRNYQGRRCDSVWTINSMDFVIPHRTRAFWMDDLRWLEARTDGNYKASVDLLKKRNTPVTSSREYPEMPFVQEFPLELVCSLVALRGYRHYFNNSGAWLIALAVAKKYTEIHLHGLDYLADHEGRDAERACTEYWVGVADSCGIIVKINPASFLCNTNAKFIEENGGAPERKYYGYYPQPKKGEFF